MEILTREFNIQAGERVVPIVLWTPAGPAIRRPLLLIGHGGSQHKTHPGVVTLASSFVLNHSFAVAAIDGPIHGARRVAMLSAEAMQVEFLKLWKEDNRIDLMIADWKASIDALSLLDDVDPDVIGWIGVSMGTAYGLPLAAADSRIKVALFGMWSADFANSQRLVQDAPKVVCPIFFQQKWDDQLFTRAGQIELFSLLGSKEKWLKIYPGPHVPIAGDQLADAEAFLSGALETLAKRSGKCWHK